ncbi:MAG: glycosyltransferase family 4 protein [Acidimicrobiales bacterium]
MTRRRPPRARPLLMHLTTADISLELLIGPQLSAFRAAGYEVVGVSAPGPFVEQVTARGVEHVPLGNATRSMNLTADVAALGELVKLFRERRPDIVHTHNPKTGVYGRIAAKLAGVPRIVNTVHGLYATPEDPLLRRVAVYSAERIAATCSHIELVQNPEDITTLRSLKVPARKLRELGNGIDLARFANDGGATRAAVREELGIAPDAVVVGAIGRLVREKGYLELFEAWAEIRASVPNAELLVVGPYQPDKSDGIDESVVAEATAAGIRFLGMRDDVERIYQALDVYVLLSYREGFPRSAMEAAAAGLPIVATDIRGCRQVVDDGVTGTLVPKADAHAAAVAIRDLVLDDDRRAVYATAAVERARTHFDQERVIAITLEAYRDLMGGWSPTPLPPTDTSADNAEARP